MNLDATEPLTPPNCDLRDFQFMPLDVRRLLTSETWVLGTGDERAAAMCLWLESWHQVPAGSLPNNDRMLRHLAQCDRWEDAKGQAMRGWILCTDGRLYHPVVAEKALEAWIEKLLNRAMGAAGNAKRWGLKVDGDSVRAEMVVAIQLLTQLAPSSKTLKKKSVVTILSESRPEVKAFLTGSPPDTKSDLDASPPDEKHIPTGSPPDGFSILMGSPSDRNRQGQGQGQGQVNLKPINLLSGNPDDADIRDQGQLEITSDASDPVREVIDYLNARAGTHFRAAESNARLIRARFKEGASVADMKAVIDAQNRKWPVGDEMRQYLRPSTLFNATKFEQYLGVIKTRVAGASAVAPDAGSWWQCAGFEFEYEAINAGCSEKYAHLWRDGARIVAGEAA